MKKQMIKKLEEIAAGLPVITEQQTIVKSGKQLIAEGIKKIGIDRVDPKAKYGSTIKKNVNHLNKLKDAYKKKGDAGVEEYCRLAHQIGREQLKSSKKPLVESL